MNDFSSSSSSSLPDVVERVAASVVGLATRRHGGSGVLWRDGVVVASASLLWRLPAVSLILPGGEQVRAGIRGVDGATDIAALTFEGADLAVAERTPAKEARVGSFVFAVGRNASGLTQASFGHVGSIAGEWRSWRGGRIDRLIRLDGGLYPGLCGGAVADADGQTLGIASAAFSRWHGVVLPAATIDRVLDQLLAHGHVRQGYLGIAAQPVSAELDGEAVQGLLVSSVAADGPAARGGLKVGDVIMSIDGQGVDSLDAMRQLLKVGSQARILVARGGHGHELSFTIEQRPRSRCG